MSRTTNSNLSRNSLSFLTHDKKGILLRLYIQPRASKNEITGIHDGTALKIRLTSPPVEGAANSACIEFLADILEIRKSQLEIASGKKSRIKQVKITGCSFKEVEDKVFRYLSC
ncbi:MAG: YggU family protein [Deltaproteobacteria bacterium]|nr:YggU family protein [Deltaproteobacteria bacterium]